MSSLNVVTRSNAGVKSVKSVRAVKRRFGESASPYSSLALDDEHEPPTAGLKVQSLKRSTGLYGQKVVEVKARWRGKRSSAAVVQGRQTEVADQLEVVEPKAMDWESGWPVLPVLVRVGTPVILRNLTKNVEMNGMTGIVVQEVVPDTRFMVFIREGVSISVLKDKMEIVADDDVLVLGKLSASNTVVASAEKAEVVLTPRQPGNIGESAEIQMDNLGGAAVALAIGRAGNSVTKEGWASPKKLGSVAEGSGREGNKCSRPLVLHSLSMFTCSSIIDPIIWFDRAKAVLRNASAAGTEFSEAQGVAAVMDRAEAGSVVATWFNNLGEATMASGKLFESAFRRRFGISKTIEAAGVKMQNIKSIKFKIFDAFYSEFVDLVAIVGEARSHRDVVSNFLEALPSNVKNFSFAESGNKR